MRKIHSKAQGDRGRVADRWTQGKYTGQIIFVYNRPSA
jgi:hypothetical protein